MGESSFLPLFTASAHRHERIVADVSLEALRAPPQVSKPEKLTPEKSNQDKPAAPSADIEIQAQGSIAQPKATVQRRVRAIVEEQPAVDNQSWETMFWTSPCGRLVRALDARLFLSWRLSMLITMLLMLRGMQETATQVVHWLAVETLFDSMSLQVVGKSAIRITVSCRTGCVFRRRSPPLPFK